MNKIIVLITVLSLYVVPKEKYLTKSGEVSFEASVPSFEKVAATNHSVTGIINTANGEVAALALIKGFRFKNALMEEHFNENYAESHKYPKSTFKGKIKNFNAENLNSEPTSFTISGDLEFHGKSIQLDEFEIQLSKTDGSVLMTGDFMVQISDFDIEIPSIVENKIAKTVKVNFNFSLKED